MKFRHTARIRSSGRVFLLLLCSAAAVRHHYHSVVYFFSDPEDNNDYKLPIKLFINSSFNWRIAFSTLLNVFRADTSSVSCNIYGKKGGFIESLSTKWCVCVCVCTAWQPENIFNKTKFDCVQLAKMR